MEERVPMMIFPISKVREMGGDYRWIGAWLAKLVFSLKYDLEKAEIEVDIERYSLASFLSAIFYGVLFFFTGSAFGLIINKQLGPGVYSMMTIFGVFAFIGFFLYFMLYPKMRARQLASAIDSELVFAIRSMLIQLSSGVSLFETMKSISRSNYGAVSKEFSFVVGDISTGSRETESLEKLAFKTQSETLKKTIWQLITTIKGGGSMVSALAVQVDSLIANQMDSIKSYAAELNLWILMYLIVAAALPSLGVTFLVIISSLSGGGVGKEIIISIVILSIMVQMGMIMFVRTRTPRVVR
ncbi:MAG: type II secretion system F family protein [Candidatus Diapherotrites archaeon]|nr:type II secretion system F family protein [Candidatus Diapherotrites archaeon]